MTEIIALHAELAWAATLLFAWFAGEYVRRWVDIPRICIYGLIGFFFAGSQLGILQPSGNEIVLLLANVAFGLILFEVGYRINLRWFRVNYWISLGGIVEAILTFAVVYSALIWNQIETTTALLLAALVMSTSPAGLIRVINEQRSSGQVTERAIHLSVLSCVVAAFVFKAIVGYQVFQTSGSIWQAGYNSLVIFVVSALLGYSYGIVMPALLRRLGRFSQDGTLAFAMAVILLVALTHAFKLSPIVATLTFGITARHRRIALSQTRRNFGALGDLLTVLLFVFVASTLKWDHVQTGFLLAVVIILIRALTKVIGTTLFSYLSGISWKKGMLTGLAMSPISVFVILTLEQTRYLGVDLVDQLMPLAAITLILELLGPILTQRALIWARETPGSKET